MTDRPRRRILVILVDRANYGRLKPVMRRIQDRRELELLVCCAGSMVLERFGCPANMVREDGFPVSSEIFMEIEGSTPMTMAKSVGFGVVEFATELARLEPDFVLIIGDRYETLAAAVAASYMNIPIVHMQGGEVSGSIDESTRHALTRFAHFHFPATRQSAEYLVRMGEEPETILGVGCPSSDIALELDRTLDSTVLNSLGSGARIDVDQPYLLALLHPTTTEFGEEKGQMQQLLGALDRVAMQSVLLWPNRDAGADHISQAIRLFGNGSERPWLRTLTNLSPEDYLKVLAKAACAVGNSSSFVRDTCFFGTPVVLVGNRQNGRERGPNVLAVEADTEEITRALHQQLANGRFPASDLYGTGGVSQRLVDKLVEIEPYVQKALSYRGSRDSTASTTNR